MDLMSKEKMSRSITATLSLLQVDTVPMKIFPLELSLQNGRRTQYEVKKVKLSCPQAKSSRKSLLLEHWPQNYWNSIPDSEHLGKNGWMTEEQINFSSLKIQDNFSDTCSKCQIVICCHDLLYLQLQVKREEKLLCFGLPSMFVLLWMTFLWWLVMQPLQLRKYFKISWNLLGQKWHFLFCRKWHSK